MQFNAVDALLLVLVLAGAWGGWSRGFLAAALDLLTLAASLAAAFLGYRPLSGWAAGLMPALGVWAAPLAFVLLFLLVHLVLASVLHGLLARLPGSVQGNAVNRLFGLLPGALNGALYAVIASALLLTLPLGAVVGRWANASTLAPRLAAPAEWAEAHLAPIFEPALRRTLDALMVEPQSRTSIPLGFRTTEVRPRPDLEAQMLELVNAERQAAGVKPVRPDPDLAEVARAHSRDMLARGYFSHYSPEGHDVADRLRQARASYLSAGENLALAPTLYSAHKGLMRSPGHRANILRPQFGRLGIGIVDAGGHGLMVTQAYRN